MNVHHPNASPLTLAQARAALGVAARELTWGLPEATDELRRWRRRACAVPDPHLRRDAEYALASKRTHADGAALFSVLPKRRDCNLLRLLVTYETILDYLDEVSERHPTEANGRELHRALIDALDPGAGVADYYRHHPQHDDAGYLLALVEACRRRCLALPSLTDVRPFLTRELERTQVLALNHLAAPADRDAALAGWAHAEFPEEQALEWYELSAAASASLVVHSLIALAAETDVTKSALEATRAAYWPWTSLATAMLDSFVDQLDDDAAGAHSYIAHYPTQADATARLSLAFDRAFRAALEAPRGHRHAVIVAAMIAMYLSKGAARDPPLRATATQLLHAGGTLPRLLAPVLRGWRTAYRQQSS